MSAVSGLSLRRVLLCAGLIAALSSCGQTTRMGMVRDEQTGLQFGSVVERPFTTDASFYRNRKLKLRLRNTSGDAAFDMAGFSAQIREAYRNAGYIPVDGDDFGLLLDVNVVYSGQVQQRLTEEYAFLGAAAGAAAGYGKGGNTAGTLGGTAAGATLGAILGSYMTDDTYIVISHVTFGIVREPVGRDGRTIVFDRSALGHPEDEAEREERRRQRGFRDTSQTQVAVYAGGRNIGQSQVSGAVRERLARILSGFL